MNSSRPSSSFVDLDHPAAYELRFRSLFNSGRALCFPCDEQGGVRLDALSDKARENYLFARAVVGREFASPVVQRCSH